MPPSTDIVPQELPVPRVIVVAVVLPPAKIKPEVKMRLEALRVILRAPADSVPPLT